MLKNEFSNHYLDSAIYYYNNLLNYEKKKSFGNGVN